jgi:hypothetical protein
MKQVTTLQGRKFYIDAWGATMTSRNAYDPELWIVVEDKGATCIIAEVKNGLPYEHFRREWTRQQVENQLKSHTCYKHIGEYEIIQ